MKLIPFIAENTTEAIAQVHAQLGPDAVVVSVRPVPASGPVRFWGGKRRIEVLATSPEAPAPVRSAPEKMDAPAPDIFSHPGEPAAAEHWPSVAWLATMGLLPACADALQARLRTRHGEIRPPSLEAEWAIVRAGLNAFWKPVAPALVGPARPHVFIGPAGTGKTTVLCKWLTLAVLTEEKTACVWRLDGGTTNPAEMLGIHCEMLGVPLKRFWAKPEMPASLLLVDLPGVEIHDAQGMAALRAQLATLPSPHVHLVLNAAYEWPVLMAQWQAFADCHPEDFIFTHLDEERQRVKLWNFVLGTNCSIRFLSAGQKVPGEFRAAKPEYLFPGKNTE